MSQFSTTVETAAAILTIPALVGAVLFKPLHRFFKGVGQFLDSWNGLPARPGYARIPGVPERIQTIEAGLAADRAEVKAALAAQEASVRKALEDQEKRTATILADIDVKMTDVHKETQKNGGFTIKDQINRLDPEYPPKEGA